MTTLQKPEQPRRTRPQSPSRQRGVAAIMAMMFLVIFGSLAAAMAIVSQGNLRTAESHMKINRTLAASETALDIAIYRLNEAVRRDPADLANFPGVYTTAGLLHGGVAGDPGNAYDLWNDTLDILYNTFNSDINLESNAPVIETLPGTDPLGRAVRRLHVGPIRIGPGAPDFTATFTQHPIPGEDYDSAFYDRMPYGAASTAAEQLVKEKAGITWVVSNAAPLDNRFVRVRVVAYDDGNGGGTQINPLAPAHSRVYRSAQMDFQLTKRIPFAVLSRSRVMIGHNVMVDGPIGSRFMEVNLANGHPMQMASDFRGLDNTLDSELDALIGTLITNDVNHDNRINLLSSTETAGIADPQDFDKDGDGFITDFDFFIGAFDANGDGRVSRTELGADPSNPTREQLFDLINKMSPNQGGDNPDFIDGNDFYAKIRGQVSILAEKADWEAGAAGGPYQDHLQGPILPDYGETPLEFGDSAGSDLYAYDASSFDVSQFSATASTTIADQAAAPIANDPGDPTEYVAPSAATREAVPFGAAYPYDYFDRPVYRNMVFDNARIPKGTNALFEDCRFIGVTYIETEPVNSDLNYNYAGMQEADGTFKHPDKIVTVNGVDYGGDPNTPGSTPLGTKLLGNNLRFHNCRFEGAIVGGTPSGGTLPMDFEFTHTRNKVSFTGNTVFDAKNSPDLSAAEKALYERSTMMLPHFSVELGSFDDGYSSDETVELSGTVVAGLIDIRGQADIEGTIITTFEPQSDQGPVIGDTSPQFNTTLGYFGSADGDLETELPGTGLGEITLRYNPNIPLPDGINGPIMIVPIRSTFAEGGK